MHGDRSEREPFAGLDFVTTNASGAVVAEQRPLVTQAALPLWRGAAHPGWGRQNSSLEFSGILPTDLQYTGQRREAGLGIYDYKARFFSPRLGRFLSADTLVPGVGSQEQNRYMYVEGSPIRYDDPTGHARPTEESENYAHMTTPSEAWATFAGSHYAEVYAYMCKARIDIANDELYAEETTAAAAEMYKYARNTDPKGEWTPELEKYWLAAISGFNWEASNTIPGWIKPGPDSVGHVPSVLQRDAIGDPDRPGYGYEDPFEIMLKKARGKIPSEWGKGKPNKKEIGWRWFDPRNPSGNGVRIDRGDPLSPQLSQRVDHVVVRSGHVVGRSGQALTSAKGANGWEAHIPSSDWLQWSTWNSP